MPSAWSGDVCRALMVELNEQRGSRQRGLAPASYRFDNPSLDAEAYTAAGDPAVPEGLAAPDPVRRAAEARLILRYLARCPWQLREAVMPEAPGVVDTVRCAEDVIAAVLVQY